jgi:hypothetical protein
MSANGGGTHIKDVAQLQLLTKVTTLFPMSMLVTNMISGLWSAKQHTHWP